MNKSETCKKISKTIRAKSNHIIKEWEEEVRLTIYAAKKESAAVLRDHMPGVLENMAHAFEVHVAQNERLSDTLQMAEEHGKQRAMQTDFEMVEILKEYNILRRVCLRNIFEDGKIDLEMALIFHEFIDSSILTSVNTFVIWQNDQLQKSLDDLNNERIQKDRFVMAMSHDLRTPLAAAKMSAQIILRKPDMADVIFKHIPRIVSNIDRMDHMIQDILDASLVKSGRNIPMVGAECNLGKLVEDTISDLISIHGQRFNFQPPTQEIIGHWSIISLRRIIENLGNNAIKYGSDATPVTIAAFMEKECAVISVHNEGNPIKDEEVKDLFNEFQRSDAAKNSKTHGWGIGLTLVKGLVEGHGGKVEVDTKSKSGTTFKIILPLDSRRFISQE